MELKSREYLQAREDRCGRSTMLFVLQVDCIPLHFFLFFLMIDLRPLNKTAFLTSQHQV